MISTLLHFIINLILPPVCVACRTPVQSSGGGFNRQGAVCGACFKSLNFIAAPACDTCATPFAEDHDPVTSPRCAECRRFRPRWSRGRAALLYDTGCKRLILSFKHGDRSDLAPTLAGWMANAGADVVREAEAIIPVPLHRWRLFARRYNQAALLAHALARLGNRPCWPDALIRTRATPQQGAFGWRGRRRNVAGAFQARPGLPIEGRRVLLVDDVMTTGATLSACALALYDEGAAAVDVLVLARVNRAGWNPQESVVEGAP